MTTDREREELKARLRKADVVTPIDLLAAADTIEELERENEALRKDLEAVRFALNFSPKPDDYGTA